MTQLQIIQHTEQMEAAREAFELLWEKHLVPKADQLNLTYKSTFAIRHLCWHAFLQAKGLTR